MTFAFALVRALHLASLMMLFGSATFMARLRIRIPELAIESRGLRSLRLSLAGIALVTAPLWLAFTAAQMAGDPGAMTDPKILGLTLTSTLFGQLLAVRLVLLLLLTVTLLARWEIFTAVLAGLGLALISVTSHAAASSPAHFTAIGITFDALHLLCGGIWLGGLCALAAIMAQRAPRLPAAVALFAQWGMAAVALLALTGMLDATSIVLSGPGHASSVYLGVLGAKLVLVLAMVLLALINHFRLMPHLDQAESSTALKGNINWEVSLGLGVVLLASLLGLLPPTL